ncbi:MAG: hypothetical protein KA354_22985 [Phycisphaerae bacterium]|nr:hypothetical protein [Phycisphaerae bacterium]
MSNPVEERFQYKVVFVGVVLVTSKAYSTLAQVHGDELQGCRAIGGLILRHEVGCWGNVSDELLDANARAMANRGVWNEHEPQSVVSRFTVAGTAYLVRTNLRHGETRVHVAKEQEPVYRWVGEIEADGRFQPRPE